MAREHTLYEFSCFQFIQMCLVTQSRIVFKTFMGSLRRTFVVKWKHPRSQCFQVPLIFSFACTLLKLSSVVLKLPVFPFILSLFLSVFRNADVVMICCGQVLLGNWPFYPYWSLPFFVAVSLALRFALFYINKPIPIAFRSVLM